VPSAGVYNLLQPEAARELGHRKAASVQQTGAPLLISANPGCSLQIAAALAARGENIAIAHTAEILDASIRGVPAPGSATLDHAPRQDRSTALMNTA
jgi:glycolate oxidase iron-sulfur subunit